MARGNPLGAWVRLVGRNLALIKRTAKQAGKLAKTAAKARTTTARQVAKKTPAQARPTARPAASTAGRSFPGVALGPAGIRCGERLLQRGQRYPVRITDYRCQGRSVATLAMVQGLGPAWSGGAAGQPFADARGPDASRMVWAFALRRLAKPMA